MKLKDVIKKLFDDNTNYTNPGQATNQASSLNALSTDLYTDSKRFIYELLQNADDSSESNKTVKVWIKIFGDFLVVAHSGKAFDARDLQGICNVNNGTKKKDSNKTGYKGIGFKSVFGQSENVFIYTNNEYFRFDSSYPFGWNWEGTKSIWEEKDGREFIYPWQIIPIYTDKRDVLESVHSYLQTVIANVATIIKLNNKEETIQAIQELSGNVNMFLFLKNISEICFDTGMKNHIAINRNEANRILLKQNGHDKAQWLTSTIDLIVPADLKTALQDERNIPEKLLSANTIKLTLATKIVDDGITELASDEKLLYSYLPTDETKYSLPVLVNTSFLTNANREHLHTDSKWNQWIFKSIAIEIFRWISQLVNGEYQFQAYSLIPNYIFSDELGKYFNDGIKTAVDTVSFVMSKQNQLVKVEDSIIDFTFLSEKECIGEEPIKKFIDDFDSASVNSSKVFIKNTGFGAVFKRLGAGCFEWSDLPGFLQSAYFLGSHTIEKNIGLIKHLRYLSDKETVKDISIKKLKDLPFIWDHKNNLNIPSQVYFPTAGDTNWNNPENGLAFLHKTLQDWLSLEPDMRAWIEQLGVVEKTDISFITKTLIPNAESYITSKNAIQTLRDLFSLYKKGELKTDLLAQLSNLKLLTCNGTLLTATDCFLSKIYSPRLKIEDVFEDDIFVNEGYLTNNTDKDEWKRFFKLLGVYEGIAIIKNENKMGNDSFIKAGCWKKYFEEEDKKFKPFQSTFIADSYSKIVTLNHIQNTKDNYSFAKLFWNDVIINVSPTDINQSATAYWGHSGRPGQESGNEVENYIPWFIKNVNCIPVLTNECHVTELVLLNTEEIKKIAGSYLPIFDGIELSANWRSFFNFKTSLQLSDYLELLTKISSDTTDKEKVKKDNSSKIQAIYKELLEQCANWSESEFQQVAEWAASGMLLNTKGKFTECTALKYFIDGNNSVFHDQFYFIEINIENKRHSSILTLLGVFQVTVLKQSDFELIYGKEEIGTDLINRLNSIIPYFKIWVANESKDEKTHECLLQLDNKIGALKIYEAEVLQIKYSEIGFTKNVNVHFDENKLFVTKPWGSNKVLLQLSEVLCRYYYLIGHDKELDFLLRSTDTEIKEYFKEEGLDVPTGIVLIDNDNKVASKIIQESLSGSGIKSFGDLEAAVSSGSISPEFFHITTSTYERLIYAQGLISRAVLNIISYLKKLSEYDCTNYYEIAPSVIGGITKNGNDITIVARPSDNDEVLLYYTAEFDVLEYVDAEFWYEDGSNVPHKITLGTLLKMTQINRIPITNLTFAGYDFEGLLKKPKSVDFDFDAVPFAPHKIAKIISSFANTEGGSLIFGIKESTPTSNMFVGVSTDFRVDEITKKAITLLSPIPTTSYDWVTVGEQRLFVIKTDKSEDEITLRNQKYIRDGNKTVVVEDSDAITTKSLSVSQFDKTVAIIIGIEEYKPRHGNQVESVKYAEKDALLFKRMLIEHMNVDEEDIHMFINEDALKSDLEYELTGLFNYLTEKERLVFYYVGHGFHNGMTNYLSTYDMHKQHISETAVSLRKILLDPISSSKCKSALVFIDACAQSFKDDNQRALISNLDNEEFKLFANDFPSFATFLSCQPGQSSYSCDELEHGIWTHHLAKAINGVVPETIRDNKYITDRLLNDYLAKSVAKYTKDKLGYDQNPKAILDSNSENVVVQIFEG